jgi:hypothetical protein
LEDWFGLLAQMWRRNDERVDNPQWFKRNGIRYSGQF